MVPQSVDGLPNLDQSLFPKVPTHESFIVLSGSLGRYETELVFGAIVLAVARVKRWQPVRMVAIWAIVCEAVISFNFSDVIRESDSLVTQGFVQWIRHQDEDYLVPAPKLGEFFRTYPK